VGTSKFTSSCDIAKSALAKAGLNYENVAAPAGDGADQGGRHGDPGLDGKATDAKAQGAAFDKTLASTLKGAGYPAKADPAQLNWPMTIVILTILVIYVTMVYGPIAAMLVEMFPTRIRYTSMSLPYHIGNGWFGGFLPRPRSRSWRRRATSIRLWYPIVIALATFVIGVLFEGHEELEHLRAGLTTGVRAVFRPRGRRRHEAVGNFFQGRSKKVLTAGQ
jgi:hypothetical protein